jgi:hypothetical protein
MTIPKSSSLFPDRPLDVAAASESPIPWYIWCCVAATVSIVLGSLWDLSWHKSIGRDTFWTAPHILIYLGAIVTGLICGELVLSSTFDRNSPFRDASVKVWGFKGPLGAFICIWGALAMLVSAPFDDWWHNAYGLDVKILSPPHAIINIGFLALRLGTVILVQVALNRAIGSSRVRLQWLLLYCGAILAGSFPGYFTELTTRNLMHSAGFYRLMGLTAPFGMVWMARASKTPFANTIITAITTISIMLNVWVFQLFPAQPKLGPVYHQVTHMVPPQEFPLLFIAGAFAMDLVWRWGANWGDWKLAAVSGSAFLVAFAAVQWPFADFLMSAKSANWFFATDRYAFFISPDTDYARGVFSVMEYSRFYFWERICSAFVAVIVSTRAGLALGNWMLKLRR